MDLIDDLGYLTAEPVAIVITDGQRTVHVTSEAIAVFAVTPFMIWLATRRELPGWARITSGVIAAGTLAVDGGLLLRYLRTPA